MIVVTGGTAEYRPILEAQAKRCAKFGYGHLIYDLGGLGMGIPYQVEIEDLQPTVNGDSLPPATFKPALVSKAMQAAAPEEVVCWLDADCLPLCEFEPQPSAYEAAVTLRPAGEVGACGIAALDYLNSGVVWVRKSERGLGFLDSWAAHTIASRTDQGGLNCAVNRIWEKPEWEAARGLVVLGSGPTFAYVLVLDALEWNNWHPPFTGARIAHFKRGLRSQAVNYL